VRGSALLLGFAAACGGDPFTAAPSDGGGDENAAADAATDGAGDAASDAPLESAPAAFCAAHPMARFCCDWDTQTSVSATWDGIPTMGTSVMLSTTEFRSPPHAMGISFVQTGAQQFGYAFKDSLSFPAAGVIRLAFAFKASGAPGTSIYIGKLLLHHAAGDTQVSVELHSATQVVLHVVTAQAVASACTMGTIDSVPAWHRVQIQMAHDNTSATGTGKLEANTPCTLPQAAPLPAVNSVGVQAGLLQDQSGANGALYIDDVLVDDVPLQ
jgi:hypothetical protein